MAAPGMDFGGALHFMKGGGKVYREAWANNEVVIALQKPDDHSKMTKPYLYAHEIWEGGGAMPWAPTQEDMLMEDWVVYST